MVFGDMGYGFFGPSLGLGRPASKESLCSGELWGEMLQTKQALVFPAPRIGSILQLAGAAGHLVQPSNPCVPPKEPDAQRGEGVW